MGITGAVSISPAFVGSLIGPAGVDEPAGFGLASRTEKLEPLEPGHVGQTVHSSGEPLDDLVTSLRRNLEGIDLYDTHESVLSKAELNPECKPASTMGQTDIRS